LSAPFPNGERDRRRQQLQQAIALAGEARKAKPTAAQVGGWNVFGLVSRSAVCRVSHVDTSLSQEKAREDGEKAAAKAKAAKGLKKPPPNFGGGKLGSS
jgi:hypothetical protein